MTLRDWRELDCEVFDVWNLDTPEDKEENQGEMYVVPEWEE